MSVTGALGQLQAAGLLVLVACSAGPARHAAAPTWQLRLELAVGGAESGPLSLNDVRGIGLDPQGRLYALDAQLQEVRVFDDRGGYVRTIGRAGAGPGEFVGANGIAVDSAGRLWVYDPQAGRLTGFDSAGRLLRTVPLQSTGYGYLWEGGLDDAGLAYDLQQVRRDTTRTSVLRRINLQTTQIDTLPIPDCGSSSVPSYRFPGGFMSVPYAEVHWRWFDLAGKVWCAATGTYALSGHSLHHAGPPLELLGDASPAPVTAAERDSAIAQVRAFMKGAGASVVDFDLIPRVKPLLTRMDRDAAHRYWVGLQTLTGPRIDVFDSTGILLAHATLPVRLSRGLHWVIRDSVIVALMLDSLDVPYVARLHIDRMAQ